MKKLLSIILFAVMLASMPAPVGVFAAEKTEGSLGGDTYWKFDEKTGELTVYGTGATDDYYCTLDDRENDSIMTYTYVTGFPKPDFYQLKEEIKSITIEIGITKIGRGLFREMLNCSAVSLPDTLTIIGNECFYGCGALTGIELPDSLTKIGGGAFEKCVSLNSIVWPPNVEIIEKLTLASCENLTEFEIPNTVTKIECFAGGASIEKLYIPNTVYLTEYALHAVRAKEIIIEDGFKMLPPLLSSNAYLEKLVIPKSVEYIEPGFFGTYNSFDFEFCYTGTQEELETLFEKLDPVLVDQIKMRKIVTDYVVEEKTQEETTEAVVDTTAKDTTVANTTKEENITDEPPSENSGRDDEKNNSSEYNLEIILIVIGVVIISVAVIAIVVKKKKAR